MSRTVSCLIVGVGLSTSTIAYAQRLTSGSAPEISIIRIVAALVVCIAATFALVVLVRNRSGARGWSGFRPMLSKATKDRRIAAVEVHRVTPHAEIALMRCDETEYLIFFGQSGIELLSKRVIDSGSDGEA